MKEDRAVKPNGITFTHDDIHKVVDEFYAHIQLDPQLSLAFKSVHDWPEHVRRLTHFWWIRLGGKPYMFSDYNPVPKHYFAGFNAELLQRWLQLFHITLQQHLNNEQYQLWKELSEQMGQGLSLRNELFRKQYESKSTR